MNITVKQKDKIASTARAAKQMAASLEFLKNEPGLHRLKMTFRRLADDASFINSQLEEVLRRHA